MGRKILIADDSATIQKVIRLALQQEGYEMESVSNGKEALEKIPLWQPDVVLVDYNLPEKDAFSLKKEVQALKGHAMPAFILMSNAFEQVDEAMVQELHFAGHLVKPFDPAHLRELLEKIFGKEKTSSFQEAGKEATPEKRELVSSLTEQENQEGEAIPADLPPLEDEMWQGKKEAPLSQVAEEKVLTEATLSESPQEVDDLGWRIEESVVQEERPAVFEEPKEKVPPPPPLLDVSPEKEENIPPPVSLVEGEEEKAFSQEEEKWQVLEEPALSSKEKGSFEPQEAPPTPALSVSETELREMIREELQKLFEQEVKKWLPDVAEKLLREEIRKMLSYPPNH